MMNMDLFAVAMVQTKNLRPKGFPKFMGSDFFLIGYRIFVKYINNAGKRWRGLYILKSETNQKRMKFFGNIFTEYEYNTVDIQNIKTGNTTQVVSSQSNFKVEIEEKENASLAFNVSLCRLENSSKICRASTFHLHLQTPI